MKKILAVLLAISMIATMAFAADASVTVAVKAAGNVVEVKDFSKAVNTLTGISQGDNGSSWEINVSTADDKAGATLNFDDGNFEDQNLWIKPIDMLKIDFFGASVSTYTDMFLWPWTSYGATAGDWGFTLTPIDGLTVKAVTSAAHVDGTKPTLGGLLSYNLGFGTVAATANLDELYSVALTGASFGPVNANVVYEYNKKAQKIVENAAIGLGVVTVKEQVIVDGLDSSMTLPTYFGVSGSVADVSWDVSAAWANIKEAGKVTVTPSAEIGGACGAASWTLGVKVPVTLDGGATVGIAVPYSVSLAW